MDFDFSSLLTKAVGSLLPLGYGEPFPAHRYIGLDGNPGWTDDATGYLFIATMGYLSHDFEFLPDFSVFRVQYDNSFGWYFKQVKI